jgi:hypothetical protein
MCNAVAAQAKKSIMTIFYPEDYSIKLQKTRNMTKPHTGAKE